MNALVHWSQRLFLGADSDPDGSVQSLIRRAIEDPDPLALRLLLGRGVHPDQDKRPGRSPLPRAAFLGHTEHVRILLAHGANPERIDSFGMTAMQWAAWRGDLTTIEQLHAAGAAINDAFDADASPLMLAAQEGHLDCVHALLNFGANPRPISPPTGEVVDLAEIVAKAGRPEAAELIRAFIRQAKVALATPSATPEDTRSAPSAYVSL